MFENMSIRNNQFNIEGEYYCGNILTANIIGIEREIFTENFNYFEAYTGVVPPGYLLIHGFYIKTLGRYYKLTIEGEDQANVLINNYLNMLHSNNLLFCNVMTRIRLMDYQIGSPTLEFDLVAPLFNEKRWC